MSRERLQIDTTPEIHALAVRVAARRGMSFKGFVHRALAKEDPELARLIEDQLGVVVEHARPSPWKEPEQ